MRAQNYQNNEKLIFCKLTLDLLEWSIATYIYCPVFGLSAFIKFVSAMNNIVFVR